MIVKLEACPFCGSLDVTPNQPPADLFNETCIRCKRCNAKGPPSMNLKGAADWWNTREEPDEDVKQVS